MIADDAKLIREYLEDRLERLRQEVAEVELALVRAVDFEAELGAVSSSGELKPSDGADPAPPTVPAPSPPVAPPSRNRAASRADKERHVDQVVAVTRELGGRASRGEIARRCDITHTQVKTALGEACRLKRLEMVGHRGGARYVTLETVTPVTEGPPADRGKPTGTEQAPTLQGRILSALQFGTKRMEDLVFELETPENTVRAAVGRLVREGELRTGHERGYTVYGLAA